MNSNSRIFCGVALASAFHKLRCLDFGLVQCGIHMLINVFDLASYENRLQKTWRILDIEWWSVS